MYKRQTLIYSQKNEEFVVKKGPVFANFVLADEINRSPAKVQSALLEAMQERQVTIGDNTYSLPQPFLVLATQNPLEQEGTYPLPEAQVDRFLLTAKISYPKKQRCVQETGFGSVVQPFGALWSAAYLRHHTAMPHSPHFGARAVQT